ncbi:MAG: DUF2306 domain-containing protein [Cyclobacteriaceae bacterium]|nr:DUF2306 domain-containing protein [Cyclobacteriaceae bacterium]
MKKLGWIVFAFSAVSIGLFPIMYLVVQVPVGLLLTKSPELLASVLWKIAFYQHIIFGGLALLVGWSQFSAQWRNRYTHVHRLLGKVYVGACLLSGSAALYLAYHATSGAMASLGFGSLGVLWIYTTLRAFFSIRKKQINAHQTWMIRSYALTFAAVTLRILLPLSQVAGINFYDAYPVIAWASWVPNLLVAEWIVSRMRLPHFI